MKIIRLSEEKRDEREPLFEVCEVETLIDINGKEVQVPKVVDTFTQPAIQIKIDALKAQIAELEKHQVNSVELAKEAKPVEEKEGEILQKDNIML
jgi:hypothetical protein